MRDKAFVTLACLSPILLCLLFMFLGDFNRRSCVEKVAATCHGDATCISAARDTCK